MDSQAAIHGHRQVDAAATVLHSALVCLNRGGACREQLTPGMFARPNLKGLQAVLYLLHLRIRGAARTKKVGHPWPVCRPLLAHPTFTNVATLAPILCSSSQALVSSNPSTQELQHIYPVLEPAQAREFKSAMHAWIRELGDAGAVSTDTVKFFVSAYQGSSSHRTVLMLLDLRCGKAGRAACGWACVGGAGGFSVAGRRDARRAPARRHVHISLIL